MVYDKLCSAVLNHYSIVQLLAVLYRMAHVDVNQMFALQ